MLFVRKRKKGKKNSKNLVELFEMSDFDEVAQDDGEDIIVEISASRKKKYFTILLVLSVSAVLLGLVIGLAVGLPLKNQLPPTSQPLARARALLSRNILVDGHNDLPWAYR